MSRFPKLPKLTVRNICNGKVVTKQWPVVNGTQHEERAPAPVVDEPPQVNHELPGPSIVDLSEDLSGPEVEWSEVRHKLVNTLFDNEIHHCVMCDGPLTATSPHIRCKDCSTRAYFCSKECCLSVHSWNLNPFHKPETWKVSFVIDT